MEVSVCFMKKYDRDMKTVMILSLPEKTESNNVLKEDVNKFKLSYRKLAMMNVGS